VHFLHPSGEDGCKPQVPGAPPRASVRADPQRPLTTNPWGPAQSSTVLPSESQRKCPALGVRATDEPRMRSCRAVICTSWGLSGVRSIRCSGRCRWCSCRVQAAADPGVGLPRVDRAVDVRSRSGAAVLRFAGSLRLGTTCSLVIARCPAAGVSSRARLSVYPPRSRALLIPDTCIRPAIGVASVLRVCNHAPIQIVRCPWPAGAPAAGLQLYAGPSAFGLRRFAQ
jgi:hypothetical protein